MEIFFSIHSIRISTVRLYSQQGHALLGRYDIIIPGCWITTMKMKKLHACCIAAS